MKQFVDNLKRVKLVVSDWKRNHDLKYERN